MMRKILSSLIPVLVTCTSSLCAQGFSGHFGTGGVYGAENRYGDVYGAGPDCIYVDCCERGKFTFGADWLYWKAEQDNMDFANNNSAISLPGGTSVEADPAHPKFKWHNGYRLRSAYTLADESWTLSAIYTRAPGCGSKLVGDLTAIPTGEQFVQLLPQNFPLMTFFSGVSYGGVRGVWSVKNNFVDVDAMRGFDICDTIRLRPHIGLRSYWATQNFYFDAAGGGTTTTGQIKQRTASIGLESGLWADWQIGCGFSLVGHVGGAALYSKTRVQGSALAVSQESFSLRSSERIRRGLFMADTFIGLQFDTCISRFVVNARIGWEQHILFNSNMLGQPGPGSGNMTLQGLTLGGSVSF